MLSTALRRFWLVWLIVFVDVALAAGIAVWQQPARYSVSAVVSAGPRPDSAASAGLVALLATKYVAFAASPTLAEEVAGEIGIPVEAVQEGLEVQMPERTTTIEITMTAESTEVASDVSRLVSEAVAERAGSDEYLQAEVVVPADADRAVESSGRLRLLVATTLLAGALAVAVTVAVQQLVDARARRRSTSTNPGKSPPPG